MDRQTRQADESFAEQLLDTLGNEPLEQSLDWLEYMAMVEEQTLDELAENYRLSQGCTS